MQYCTHCGRQAEDDARFCGGCGRAFGGAAGSATPAGPGGGGGVPGAAPSRKFRFRWVMLAGPVIMAGVFIFLFTNKGCSSTEGEFVAKGAPLGDFTFKPKQCRSGQRMNFFGVVLLGDGPTDGGILVIEDAVRGKMLKVEVPGSCKPPDHEVCTEILVEPKHCKVYESSIERTHTEVNDVRLLDGHLRIDCTFPEGGTAKADIRFTGCD